MDAVRTWGFSFPFSFFSLVPFMLWVFCLVSALLLLLLLRRAVCCLGTFQVISVLQQLPKKFHQCYGNHPVTSGSKFPSNRAVLARSEQHLPRPGLGFPATPTGGPLICFKL